MNDIIMLVIPVLIVTLFIVFVGHLRKMNREKKAGFAIKDERTNRIEGRAARITVNFTGFFMLALLWYVFANEILELNLPILETEWALIISVVFNSLMYSGLILYFQRKEE